MGTLGVARVQQAVVRTIVGAGTLYLTLRVARWQRAVLRETTEVKTLTHRVAKEQWVILRRGASLTP